MRNYFFTMNKHVCFIILFLAFKLSYSQNVFQKTILSSNTSMNNFPINFLPLADSSLIVLCAIFDGTVYDTTTTTVLKMDSAGNIVWQKAIVRDSIRLNYINYADNGYIITGCTFNPFYTQNVIVIKIDFNGDTLWTRVYPFAGSGNYIKQISNGDLQIIGNSNYSTSPSQTSSHMIMRTDSSGNIIYFNEYPTNWMGGVTGIATSDGGSLLYDPGLTLIKVDSLGNGSWKTPQFNSIIVRSVIETIDSSYLAFATSQLQSNQLILIKINNMGDTLWTKAMGNSWISLNSSIVQLNDGNFMLCGVSLTNNLYRKTLLIKMDASANVLWSKTYRIKNNSEEAAVSVVPFDNGYIIIGSSYDTLQNKYAMTMIKTDSLGNTNCVSYNGNFVNELVNSFTTTNVNIQTSPIIANLSNFTFSCQNSSLYTVGGCLQTVSVSETPDSNFNSVLVYPNPFNEKVNIMGPENEDCEIIIYDISCRFILKYKFVNSGSLNTETLGSGIYFYEVRNKNALIKKGKLVKI